MQMEISNGTEWRTTGILSGAEPAVSSNYAVRVALPDNGSDIVRLRLSSSPGLWMIDRIAIDYGPWRADHTMRVRPMVATDQSGESVYDEIVSVDRRYHDMPEIGERIDLVFDAPAPTPGSDRTVVLAATGYYTIHVETEGPPQTELADRLLSKPRAFPVWALQGLNQEIAAMLAEREVTH
jgi:hypothetical protein